MSAPDLALMARLRQALRLSSQGKGVAASMVETFKDSRRAGERDMVRSILLGHPVGWSMRYMEPDRRRGSSSYTRDLMLFAVEQAKVDAAEASRRAEKLTTLFEHWIWMTRQRVADQKVLETRSILVSGILGGVTAMVSTLAPVLSSFQLSLTATGPAVSAPAYSRYLGIFFVLPAASSLGIFFSRRRAYLNVLVACGAYILVTYFFGSLVLAI